MLGFGTQMRLNNGLLHLPPELFFAFGIPGYDHLRSWGRYGIFVTLVATFASADIVSRWLRRHPQPPRATWAAVAVVLVLVAVDQQPQWPSRRTASSCRTRSTW